MTRTSLFLLAALLLALPLQARPALAQDSWAQRCYNLWYERNAIYAARGYCFRTPQAQAVFGPGCFPPYGELTPAEKRRVAQLQAMESRMGCR